MKNNQPQQNTSKNWQLRKLDSMFTVRRGGSPRPIENYITNREDGLNWLKIGDIDVGAKYITSTSSKILKEGLSRTTLVKKGDFILSNSMSFGRPYIMNIDACIHDGWLTFQDIKTDILDRDFLYYLLSQSKTQSIFASISAGSGVQNLKKETVAEIELSIPPLFEQNRIVSVLETWDKSIERLTKKIEVKKQIKKGLMQDLLTGKKRLSGFTDKWEIITIANICNKENSDVSANTLDFNSGKYPIYGASGFIKNIDFYRQDKAYISIVKDGAGVGRLTLHKAQTSVLGTLNILTENENSDLFFLYFLLQTIDFKKYVIGSTIPHIYFKDYKKEKVTIPQIKEQTAIAKIITTADLEITTLENKLKVFKEQKRYLLNNLITGTIRTPENLSKK